MNELFSGIGAQIEGINMTGLFDCDVTQCPRKKEQYIPPRANGKSKLSLIELINKTDLPQEQKDEIIKAINEIY